MPHFPEWFVIICILLPIANLIYKHGKTERNSRIGGNNENNGMDTLSCLRRQNP